MIYQNKTMIKSIQKCDVKNKRVLLRVDFNVPIENNVITDDIRIKKSLPTIKHLIKNKAKVIIITHIGRPKGEKIKELQTDIVAKHLSKLLKQNVKKLEDSIGEKVENEISKIKNGEVVMLENIRFYKEENINSKVFSKKLAKLADIYVNDAFGTSHKKEASTYGVAQFLPSYIGLLMEEEITQLSKFIDKNKKSLTLIIGGAKIDTKIGIIKNYINKADNILIGGALANTFLKFQGVNIGKSIYESEKLKIAEKILKLSSKSRTKILLPIDATTCTSIKPAKNIQNTKITEVKDNQFIVDIGTQTQKKWIEIIKESNQVILNGPLGLYEVLEFSKGTKKITTAISKNKHIKSVIGGGDTLDAIKKLNINTKNITHISTGGGAMIEFLSGNKIPIIELLKTEKKQ